MCFTLLLEVYLLICCSGKILQIVNGAYRGETAILESIDEKKFSCTVFLSAVSTNTEVLHKLELKVSLQ